ncbi:hypothetical protein B0H21DRAFT_755126 [Amylocystis lapponica]|nr:hypothetical protein B0H21DRAFT_755126 [Amylocystis lapponica]
MTTLAFPWPQLCGVTTEYTLTRVDNRAATRHLIVRDPVLIHKGNNTAFRATLFRDDGRPVSDVVCKFAHGKRSFKRLRREAVMYCEQLKELQGRVVPKFYGFYQGETVKTKLMGCIITRFCGEISEVPFFGLSWDSKIALISALLTLHDAGVEHGDLRECNVVFSPKGRPYIIDFDHAKSHVCESMKIMVHGPAPTRRQFGCDELFDACKEMGLWTPSYILYLSIARPLEYTESAEKLATLAPKNMDPGFALCEAMIAIDEYRRRCKRRIDCDWR